jgi:hypothetical protein
VGHYGTRRGLAAFFALGHYGLLGARGIRLSWSALRGKSPLLCWQDSLGVGVVAQLDTGAGTPWADTSQTARKQPRKATWVRTGAEAQVLLMKWRHLVRKPAKLTGTRRELCTWGGARPEPGVGSLRRKRYTLHPVR